jgi:hypothetical protein
MAGRKLYKLLLLICCFAFLSCGYKESFRDKIYIFHKNCTDLQVELKIVWPDKRNASSFVPKKILNCKTYRFLFKDLPQSGQAILLYDGKPVETVLLKFPGGGFTHTAPMADFMPE